jgi:hypothetical protein
MSYNMAAVRAARARKDSAARDAARARDNRKAPFVEAYEFLDGDYRIRLWPTHSEKNPLGFLDYRVHEIPRSYDDPRPELIQCPRSNNWDPLPFKWENADGDEIPFSLDADGQPVGYPVYKERCLCCEILEWVNEDDGLGHHLFDTLPENLQLITSNIDHEVAGGKFGSALVFPATIKMSINSKIKQKAESGKEYERIDYCASEELFTCVLKFKHNRKLTQDLFDILGLVPDLCDSTVGRWLTLRKQNEGKGVGGYTLLYDPNPSSVPWEWDWRQHTSFTNWGKGSRQRPGKRFTMEQQIMKIETTDWGKDLEAAGVPLCDEDAVPF